MTQVAVVLLDFQLDGEQGGLLACFAVEQANPR
jgi:hypothetical protein